MEFRGRDLRAAGRVPRARRQVHRAGPQGGNTVAAERVLVTGASGYIGRLTLARLAALGYDVHATSRRPPPDRAAAVWLSANLIAPGEPERLIHGVRPAVVLHFAWDVTPGQYWNSAANDDWQRATHALARAHFAAGGRRFVGAGTCAEYDWTGGHCDERTTPLAPASRYGRAKLAAWRAVEADAAAAGAQAAWGRIFFLFGGDEHAARLAPSVARALLAGEPARCTHGEQRRDFLDVDDVADAFVALTASACAGPVNIASGETHRVRDVIDGIAARIGRPDLVRLGARPSDEPPLVSADVRRLREEVGWRPARTFDAALDAVVRRWAAAPTSAVPNPPRPTP